MNETITNTLTKRQEEIAIYVKKGFKDHEIADFLEISTNTVKTHLKTIYSKLNVSGRTELAGLDDWTDTEIKNHIDISGYWLSKFEYLAFRAGLNNYVCGVQYDLEFLTDCNDSNFFTHKGENIFCSSTSKIEYFHDLSCYVEKNNLIGIWINKKKTRNIGCFQLYISNNSNIMIGKHLGNASDNSIQPGNWLWVKIEDANYPPDILKKSFKLNPFDEIDPLFTTILIDGSSINFNEIARKR